MKKISIALLFLLLLFNISGFSQPPAIPGAIAGQDTICPNDGTTFSIDTVAGATSYAWTVPSGVIINSGQGTTSINVTFQNTSCWAGNDITVTASNAFGASSPQTLILTYQGAVVFDNYNIDAVSDGGISPSFTIASSSFISMIYNYHWYGSVGASPGTISLFNTGTGITYGPWAATAGGGCGGTQTNWTVWPATTIPTGTYQVIDSDPATWSYNNTSGGYGFTHVESCTASIPPSPQACPPFTGSQTNVSCFGDNDGTATVNISGSSLTFLWNTTPPQTTATATGLTAGTYTVSITDTTTTELIVNGDFSSGNTGFSTSYSYCNTPGCLGPEGYYAVDTDPSPYNGWTGAGHTTTSPNNFMIVNGSPVANQTVWCQTVAVTPNSNYNFSTWISTMDPGAYNPAELQFSINGINLGSTFIAPLAQNVWWQFSITWNSGANTSATICIVNQNIAAGSNDFGLDDISFVGIGQSCDTIADFIITQPAQLSSTNNVAICSGDSIFLEGNWQTIAGTYYDTLTSVNGCDSVISTALSVNQPPVGNQQLAICSGDSILLQGGYQTTAGTYYDTLISVNGCDSIIATTLTVNSTVTIIATAAICNGDSVFLEGNWQSITGTYSDTLISANGCDSILQTSLTVNPKYAANVNTSICLGDSIFLAGEWQNTAGIYYDSLPSLAGCDSIIKTSLTIKPLPLVEIGADTTIIKGSSIQIIASGGTDYSWSPATGLSCTNCSNPIASPESTITYYVSVNDADGCTNMDSIIITVEKIQCDGFEIFIPNIFSPNNDGLNDILFVRGKKECMECFLFSIYDRWGEKVFESDRMENGWDGNFRGKTMNDAVFVYYLKVKLTSQEEIKEIRGNVTIVK